MKMPEKVREMVPIDDIEQTVKDRHAHKSPQVQERLISAANAKRERKEAKRLADSHAHA